MLTKLNRGAVLWRGDGMLTKLNRGAVLQRGDGMLTKLNWGAVLLAGKQYTVRLDVPVDDVIVVAVLQGLKSN